MSAEDDPRVKAFERRRRKRRSDIQSGRFVFRVVLEQLASFALFCGATMVVAPYFAPMYRNWETILSKVAAAAILFNMLFAGHWAWASLVWIGLACAIVAVERRRGQAAAQRLMRRSGYVVVAVIAIDLLASIVIPGYEWTYVAD